MEVAIATVVEIAGEIMVEKNSPANTEDLGTSTEQKCSATTINTSHHCCVSEEDFLYTKSDLTHAVRRKLCPALRDLIQHGLGYVSIVFNQSNYNKKCRE